MATVDLVESAQLQTALAKSGLSNPELVEIRDAFQPLFAKAEEIVKASESIVVVDATCVTEIRAARSSRLELKAIRVEAEKSRKALKESALKRGQVIDEAARVIKGFIEPVEDRLLAMEETAERAEAARKEALRVERSAKVVAAGGDPSFYQLGDMPEASFAAMLDGLLAAARAAKEAAEKAEAERLARLEADRAEQARIKAERDAAIEEARKANEAREAAEAKARAEREAVEKKARDDAAAAKRKADAERAAIEAKAKAEREAAEAAARKERVAREKVEAELAAKKRAEEKAAADAEKARKTAERAPDADKLYLMATWVRTMPVPAVKSAEAVAALAEIADGRERFAKWIEARAASLTT